MSLPAAFVQPVQWLFCVLASIPTSSALSAVGAQMKCSGTSPSKPNQSCATTPVACSLMAISSYIPTLKFPKFFSFPPTLLFPPKIHWSLHVTIRSQCLMARNRLVRFDSAVDESVLAGPVLLSPHHHSLPQPSCLLLILEATRVPRTRISGAAAVAWEVARSRAHPSGLVEVVCQLRASDSLNGHPIASLLLSFFEQAKAVESKLR